MQTRDMLVVSEQGLHAKPADLFVRAANRYASEIKIMNLSRESGFENAKSILKVLSLGIYKGHSVRIQADGVDEYDAVSGLAAMIKNDFSE